MSASVFDPSKHPRNRGKFASARAAAAIAAAPDSVRYGGGMSLSGIPAARVVPKRSMTRGEAWQRIGSRIDGLPAAYTGEKTMSRPVGSYLHLEVTNQIPKRMSVKEHQDRVARYLSLVKDSRAEILADAEKNRPGKKHVYLKAHEPAARGVAKWRMKPDLYPEGTPRSTLNRAYNHAALIHMHERGLADTSKFKMDDDLKAELKPTEPFMRYTIARLKNKADVAMPGEVAPYREAFGQAFHHRKYGAFTGKVSTRLKPNKQLVKAFDPGKHQRDHNGRFAGAIALGAVSGGAGYLASESAPKISVIGAQATGMRRRAQSAYRAELKNAKATGAQVVFRGAPDADPAPRHRGFTGVYVARKRDVADMYGQATSRYVIDKKHKFVSMHDDDMKHLFGPLTSTLLPKSHDQEMPIPTTRATRVIFNTNLWGGLEQKQAAKLKEMGYAGAESPQIERHDAYVLHDPTPLRYVGAGFRGELRGGRIARNIARSSPLLGAAAFGVGAISTALASGPAKKAAAPMKKAAPIGAVRAGFRRAAGFAARKLDSVSAPAAEQQNTYQRASATVQRVSAALAGKGEGATNRGAYTVGRAAANTAKRAIKTPISTAKGLLHEGAQAGSGFFAGAADGFGAGPRTRLYARRAGAVVGAGKAPIILGLSAYSAARGIGGVLPSRQQPANKPATV